MLDRLPTYATRDAALASFLRLSGFRFLHVFQPTANFRPEFVFEDRADRFEVVSRYLKGEPMLISPRAFADEWRSLLAAAAAHRRNLPTNPTTKQDPFNGLR